MSNDTDNKTIRRMSLRVNEDDGTFIGTLCQNTSMNESEAIKFCMYVTRELLQADSINIHIKGVFLKSATELLSTKLKRKVNKSVEEGEKFDTPNDERRGWHKCINIFQGIITIRKNMNKKRVNRLG